MRKHFILLIIIYLWFTTFCFAQKELNENNITRIEFKLSEKLTIEDQWVYWFSSKDNQTNLIDSTFVKKGQEQLIFENHLGADENYISWITFSKYGPKKFMLYLQSGENVKIHENYIITGSPTTKENIDNIKTIFEYNRKIYNIRQELENTKKANLKTVLEDSLKYYEEYREKWIHLDFFSKGKTPYTCLVNLSMLDFLPKVVFDSLVFDMKKRFPNSGDVQRYPTHNLLLATEESKRALKRFLEITDKKMDIEREEVDKNELKNRLDSVQSFALGSKIENLSLPGLSGEDISIDNIQSKYILIDFWASWCTPCRKEFPNVKATYDKYKDKLTVYAISLDNTEKEWKETIGKDKLEMFTHVYGGSPLTFETQKLSKMFGVNAIPANFLLDKDRKIIAVNLRGDALIKKMEEIIDSEAL